MTNEFWNKNIRKISLLIITVVIVLILWSLVISPFLVFKNNEKTVLEAGKRFFEINRGMIPTGEKIVTIPLQKLYDKDMISEDLRNPYGSGLCDSKNSWIKAKKINGELNYYVYLKCGVYSSNIDHDGPVITLKGEDEIILNKGDKYEELGVDNVVDNTDGSIDIKKVKIDSSKVNTKKNGIYEVTYKIKDSMNNETIKIRTVKVEQVLSKIVKNDTKDTNGYYKDNAKYIMIDGILFNIVGINDDDTIKVVSAESLAYVDNNSVDKWLNDYFYNKLSDNAKKYIVNSKWCNEKITNPNSYKKCNGYSSGKNIGLLSVADLNNMSYDIQNEMLTTNNYVADPTGYKKINNKKPYGINPVINLKKDINSYSGNGSYEKPFSIPGNKSSKAGTKISELKVGEYVTYSGYDLRIIGSDENSTRAVMVGVLLDPQGDEVYTEYGTRKYDPDDKQSIAYKISNDYSSYVSAKKLVKNEEKVFNYKNYVKYDNGDVKNSTYKFKSVVVSLFDLFSPSADDLYWFRESINNKAYYNTPSKGASTYEFNQDNVAVKLVFNLSNEMTTISGKGIKNIPYKIK